MVVSSVIGKPVNKEELIKYLIWKMQQDKIPTDQSAMERNMRQFLKEKNISEAQNIKERYVEDKTIKIGAKVLIEADFSFANLEYDKARYFGIEDIKHSEDSIFTLSLLSKIMMNLREFEISLKCFEKDLQIDSIILE